MKRLHRITTLGFLCAALTASVSSIAVTTQGGSNEFAVWVSKYPPSQNLSLSGQTANRLVCVGDCWGFSSEVLAVTGKSSASSTPEAIQILRSFWENRLYAPGANEAIGVDYFLSLPSANVIQLFQVQYYTSVAASRNLGGKNGSGSSCNTGFVGDPFHAVTGDVYIEESDGRASGISGPRFNRVYNSQGDFDVGLSGGWSYEYSQRLSINIAANTVLSVRENGSPVSFTSANGVWSGPAWSDARLVQNGTAGWRMYTGSGSLEVYDTAGALTEVWDIAGRHVTVARASGLVQVRDQFGRGFDLQSDSSGNVTQIVDPQGAAILGIAYTAITPVGATQSLRVPSSVTFSDASQRVYHYADPNNPVSLTGIVDENQSALTTPVELTKWSLDQNGAAVSSLEGGIISTSVQRNGLQTTVTGPLGAISNMSFQAMAGQTMLSSKSQPAGSGCAASTSNQVFDANGNATQKDDFNGNRVCTAFDLTRNLESVRVEGLATTAACSGLTTSGAILPAGSRKSSTQWHPDWRLATRLATPGHLVTRVYNGQPDPFNGNAIASCAPPAALLPDGKPIVVLCKTVDQATTDVDGSQGYAATLQAGVPSRVSTWTYNQFGQVLSAKGPRTDVNDTTNYAYYTDTTIDHTLGDLQTLTNAAGQVTQYTKYSKLGQSLEMIDPNGVVTTNTYDVRARLTSTSIGGQTTTYAYDAAGQLIKVTLPDASFVGYEYDTAHRQTATFDNLGNRIEYTLDNLGNRIAENVKDATGALKRQLTRSMDALNRVQQATGRL